MVYTYIGFKPNPPCLVQVILIGDIIEHVYSVRPTNYIRIYIRYDKHDWEIVLAYNRNIRSAFMCSYIVLRISPSVDRPTTSNNPPGRTRYEGSILSLIRLKFTWYKPNFNWYRATSMPIVLEARKKCSRSSKPTCLVCDWLVALYMFDSHLVATRSALGWEVCIHPSLFMGQEAWQSHGQLRTSSRLSSQRMYVKEAKKLWISCRETFIGWSLSLNIPLIDPVVF